MRILLKSALIVSAICSTLSASAYSSVWQQISSQNVPSKGKQIQHPAAYTAFALNTSYMQSFLQGLSKDYKQAGLIELPMADGTIKDFKVWQVPMMEDALAARHADIMTFTAEEVDNPRITAKLDITPLGFHAMIYNGENTSFVDPYSNENDGYYLCHYKRDEQRDVNQHMICHVKGTDDDAPGQEQLETPNTTVPTTALRVMNGYTLRTYRLALACTAEYAAAVGGTTPNDTTVLAAMVTSVNRVNGVYEKEFSIHMNLIANEDTLIYLNASNEPYTNSDGSAMLAQNQTVVDQRIGTANYDIGHVFSTGGGGIAIQGAVCDAQYKAQGVTGSPSPIGDGFDIDYVAHEMGHEYGASHPFNNNQDGSCSGNANRRTAYEPGSGSTIMAYAGICSPDDLQPHSDAYFTAISLQEISAYTTTGVGNNCGTKTATNNKVVSLPLFSDSFYIPCQTPFELTAPVATDSVSDTLTTYCWEQADTGKKNIDYGIRLTNTHLYAPMFRSFSPDTGRTRVFPKLDSILRGTYSYTGSAYEDKEGEKLPDSSRSLKFKLTVRDVYQGYGCVLTPDDTIKIHALNTGTAFAVTSQNTTGVIWAYDTAYTVTWNVASTSVAPISCDSVDIYLATDGYHFTTSLGRFANSGSAQVIAPILSSPIATARIKVKGSDNIFFNVNSKAFTIQATAPEGVNTPTWASSISVYPVPATETVNINSNNIKELEATVYNSLGQSMWKGSINGKQAISVNGWAKGAYYIQMNNSADGSRIVKAIIVE